MMENAKNPLHKAVVSEWRGLMAVLCLKEWLKLNVEVDLFEVPQVRENERSSVGAEDCGDLHFRAALRNQLPRRPKSDPRSDPDSDTVGQQTLGHISDWERWWMIRCNKALLGATSPWSIVYTASHYHAPAAIPWQTKGGLLIDPILHYDTDNTGRSTIELAILYEWVSQLLESRKLWGFPSELGTYKNLFSATLEAWKLELKVYEWPDLKLEMGTSPIDAPPFSTVLRAATGQTGDFSDVYLSSQKHGKVLVLHAGMSPGTRVFRGVFADRLDINKLDPEGDRFLTKDGIVVDRPYIIPERLFFPSKLIQMDMSHDSFISCNSSTPLQPSFFKYLDYDDLKELSVATYGGSITATLGLTLESNQNVQISKTYRKEDVLSLESADPALALWPNEYDPEWSESFAGYAAPPESELIVAPLFNSGRVSDDQAGPGKHQNQVRIWKLTEPAIGFALQVGVGENQPKEDAGVVLRRDLNRPKDIDPISTWRIGVDFGTSSTTVMYDNGSGSVHEIPFRARLLALVKPGATSGGQEEIARNLYPDEDVTPPFRTLLYKASDTATVFGADSPYTMRFASDIQNDLLNQPIEGLKWGMGKKLGTNPLTAYLGALARYIIWEARCQKVGKVQFIWSYPTSLPKRPLSDMEGFWNSLPLTKWHKQMSIDSPQKMSESKASCRALTEKAIRIHGNSLTITVDIGGGSTDMAFWSEKKLLDQISFKLAGNDMLDRDFLSADTLAELYRICTGQSIPPHDMPKLLKRPEIYVNGALAAKSLETETDPRKHPICSHIFKQSLQGEVPWQQFRSMVYLFFTGLCYYMGTQTRLRSVGYRDVDVYFGGRGSAMLTWLSIEQSKLTESLGNAFLLGLLRVADDGVVNSFPAGNPTVNFHGQAVSANSDLPRLKTEVARGLLVKSEMKLATGIQVGTAAGETGWTMNGHPVAWNAQLEPEDLANLMPPDEAGFDSTMIGHYLWEIFQEDKTESMETLNLDTECLKKLKVNGADVISLVRMSADPEEKPSQPIFAYELKALMHQYAQMVKSVSGAQ
jgi:hypothetical protein